MRNGNQLSSALDVVKGFSRKRDILPILKNVLVDHNDGEFVLTTTDLEARIRYRVFPENGELGQWQVCVPVHKLADMVKGGGGTPILTVGDNHKLTIETGSGTRTLSGADPDDFPAYTRSDNEEYVNITVGAFLDLEGLDKTAKNDETNYNFHCVGFQDEQAIATDGHRLTTKRLRWLPQPWKFLVPAQALKKAVAAVKKVRKQADCVELFRSEKHLVVVAGPVEIILSFVEGEYVDTGKVEMPKGPEATFDKTELKSALRQVRIMTSDLNKGVTLTFQADRLELYSVHPDLGTAYTWIHGEVDNALAGCVMRFNVDYVLQAVQKASNKVTIVSNEAEKSPWGFGSEMIMPIKHKDETQPASTPEPGPTTSEHTDPKQCPGPGWQWEPGEDYFSGYWKQAA